jgi:DNA modification methylase
MQTQIDMRTKRRNTGGPWHEGHAREFVSQVEAIQPAEQIFFPIVQPFGKYREYLEHASGHPAKMNTSLTEFIIKKYTKRGDKILEPMAGTGGCGVVGALLGRNVVQNELVRKFYLWMEEARRNVASDRTVKGKGWIRNFCADATKVAKFFGREEFEIALTSPPYWNQNHHSNLKSRLGQLARSKTTGVGKQAARGKFEFSYSRSKRNVGNLGMEEYFWAMLNVYGNVFGSLKKGGIFGVVVRPLYRKKSVFDLPYYTWILCREIGFEIVNIYRLKLMRQSFWTLLYEKKFPCVSRIRDEYVLIVRKRAETRILVHVAVSAR